MLALLAATASAQVAAPLAPPAAAARRRPQTLAPVRVTGRAPADASVAGWGDVPLSQAPLQATSVDATQIRDERRAPPRRPDALRRRVTDAYNTEGYWDYLTVRGFVIDNRFNYRRDGLPINAETSIPLDNKARIDILKGTERHAGRHQRAGRAGQLRRQAAAERAAARGLRSSGASAAACSAPST